MLAPKDATEKHVLRVDILPASVGPLTQQLFVLQASSPSPKVVFAKRMRTEQVTQARRRQLLLQEMKQLFCYISRNGQTNQR